MSLNALLGNQIVERLLHLIGRFRHALSCDPPGEDSFQRICGSGMLIEVRPDLACQGLD
jgi:hypothetical protein